MHGLINQGINVWVDEVMDGLDRLDECIGRIE